MIHQFITSQEVQHGDFPWCHVEWMSNADLTDAQHLLLVRATFPAGEQHNFHLHPAREEIIYVISGRAEQWVGETMRTLGSGEMAHIPAGTPHATRNPGLEPLVFLAILSPTQTEGEFTEDVCQGEPWCSLLPPIAYPG